MNEAWKRRFALPGIAALSIGVCGGGWWGVLLIAIGLVILTLLCREPTGEFHFIGPFAWRELVRSGRGSRRHVWRPIYVIITLLGLILFHLNDPGRGNTVATIGELKRLTATNESFCYAYAFVLLILCPVLAMNWASELILEERHAKRWDILRTTHLTSREIVVGKAMGRLPVVLDPILATLPVLAMLTLIGGVSPLMIVLSLIGVLATTFGLGGITLFYATFSKKSGQAGGATIGIFLLYIIVSSVAAILQLSPAVMTATVSVWPGQSVSLTDVIDLFQAGNPFVQLPAAASIGVEAGLIERLPRYVAWHLFVGLLFGLVAISRLRTATPWDLQTATAAVIDTVSRKPGKAIDRPPVTDEPITWWEQYGQLNAVQMAGQRTINRWIMPRFTLFMILVFLGFRFFFMKMSQNATQEVGPFISFLVWVFAWPPIMGAMFRGAKSIARERHGDTLDALLTTELTPRDILYQKWKGVCVAEKPAVSFGLSLLVAAMVTGIIPVIGGVMFAISVAVYTMSVGAVGLAASVKAEKPESATRTLMFILVPSTFVVSLFAWPPILAGVWLFSSFQRSRETPMIFGLGLLGMIIWSVIGYACWRGANKSFGQLNSKS